MEHGAWFEISSQRDRIVRYTDIGDGVTVIEVLLRGLDSTTPAGWSDPFRCERIVLHAHELEALRSGRR
jgi:hypothetical protein